MTLPPRALTLKTAVVKDRSVLALDTGFAADSLEGMRLVKASRGNGWLAHGETLRPWVTKGVLQEDQRLVVWGETDDFPSGATPDQWPSEGDEAKEFLRAFVAAWTLRAQAPEPLEGFTPASVVPFKTAQGWAFVFLPPELRGVLDSLQPLADRLAWDHVRLPDSTGAPSWAFTSAALGWGLVAEALPWAQEDEAHLRQEIRDLKKTLVAAELPSGPDAQTLNLWFDSLTGRLGPLAVSRWKDWAAGQPSWAGAPLDAAREQKRQAAIARRTRRRAGAAFWRSKGTVSAVLGAVVLLVGAVVGSVVWGLLKPDPTDTWTPEQVVRGYFSALTQLDADQMRRLASFDKGRQPELGRDQDEATNLFVIRQVRTAYEKTSPVVAAQDWENQGRPVLGEGSILYGVVGLEVSGDDKQWTAHYRKWISESSEGTAPVALGAEVTDALTLSPTGKGWKIVALRRQRQPLP